MKSRHNIEILSPAGSPESLLAALRCGANAVYLGGKAFNARRGAHNFDSSALKEAVMQCRLRGVGVHLTLNTLVFDSELPALLAMLEEACALGVDALIVQDLATAAAVRRFAPGLPMHASTQMSIHNLDGAKMLEELGFSRVVLARELTAEEIGRIVEGTSLEVECFVHGALCMSVSGQCTLSSMIGGRSGNRGLCAQPCRLPFAVGKSSHALSLKDLSLVSHLPRLKELGVHSLKIEGRMKRPEYVAAATTACRAALDGAEADLKTLEAVFSRSGFTDGYFTGHRGRAMFGTRQKEDVQAAGAVLRELQGLYSKERQTVPVRFSLSLQEGAPARLAVEDDNGNRAEAVGEVPQKAVSAPTTKEKAASFLSKTGGTVFCADAVSFEAGEGLMLPASAINAMRRSALEKLSERRMALKPIAFVPGEFERCLPHISRPTPALRVRLHCAGQLTPRLAQLADEIALPLEELAKLPAELLETQRQKLLAELPRVIYNSDIMQKNIQIVKYAGIDKAIAGNLGGILQARAAGFRVYGDFGLNIVNSVALEEYKALGLEQATLSFELGLRQISALGGGLSRGILAYGYLPLMLMRVCPVRAAKGCGGCEGFPALKDRMGKRFFVSCHSREAAELYNYVPLYLGDCKDELKGVDFLTLYFTKEAPEECMEILQLFRRGGAWNGEKTRGLYRRAVL